MPPKVYNINVMRGLLGSVHTVRRRFNDFAQLVAEVAELSGITLQLPPKRVFGNSDAAFLAKRREALEALVQNICADPYLRLMLPVRRFLDPANYPPELADDTIKGVHMFFRSEPSWEMVELAVGIGWRMRKCHAIVK